MLAKLLGIYDSAKESQTKVLNELLEAGSETVFGRKYGFAHIRDVEGFQRNVPLSDYDALEPYILRQMAGEKYVLWNEHCRFYAKSSGTSSSKSKFIPVTPAALHDCHYKGFRMMLGSYVSNNHSTKLYAGKSLTIAGTIQKDMESGLYFGDLSGILMQNSPKLAEFLRAPNREIALISDLNEKLDALYREYKDSNIVSFAGVPAWNLIMVERMIELAGVDNLCQLWPNMELFMHGGTAFGPYRDIFKKLIPSEKMHYLENYNASEGYFAFQDDLSKEGMLLTSNNGVFYEFIPMDKLDRALADAALMRVDGSSEGRYVEFDTVETVRTGVDYAMVISTNSGLWRYLIGDCVRFVTLDPYRIVVSGRTQLYINVFGEELMIGNAERAMTYTCQKFGVSVRDYTVAPVFMSGVVDEAGGKSVSGAHQWLVEFVGDVPDKEAFADCLDDVLMSLNSDYEAKRTHTHTMQRLVLTVAPQGLFNKWMASRGKRGGQNKVPRLSGERTVIESLLALMAE